MQSRARLAKHPLHPMLVTVPTALFPLLLLLDGLYVWRGDDAFWTVGVWIAGAGVVTTLAAMIPGLVDLAGIPSETRAHRTAATHFAFGVATLGAYALATWSRWPAGSVAESATWPVAIDVAGVLLVAAQGWLGAALVYKHHLGVIDAREGGEPVALAPLGADEDDGEDDPARGPAPRRV